MRWIGQSSSGAFLARKTQCLRQRRRIPPALMAFLWWIQPDRMQRSAPLPLLRTVAKGGSYLSPQVSDRLLHRIQRGDLESKQVPTAVEGLSPRELQVLRLVAEGKTSKEIAEMLDLGLQTVRSYRKTMMKKLNVNNVASLTQLALSAGLTRFTSPANPAGADLD